MALTSSRKWYESAREVREEHETEVEITLVSPAASDSDHPQGGADARRQRQVESALRQLRVHEIVALLSCFLAPALSTYLLYFVRSCLRRPEDSLVSNFNLAVFCLGAEMSPLTHTFKLLLSQTLHLQRIVAKNPHKRLSVSRQEYQRLLARLEDLEAHIQQHHKQAAGAGDDGTTATGGALAPGGCKCSRNMKQLRAEVAREGRSAAKAEMEDILRAVRNYEKQMRDLNAAVDARIKALAERVDDAVALAMSANRSRYGGLVSSFGEGLGGVWELILGCTMFIMYLPWRATVGAPKVGWRLMVWLAERGLGERRVMRLRGGRGGEGGEDEGVDGYEAMGNGTANGMEKEKANEKRINVFRDPLPDPADPAGALSNAVGGYTDGRRLATATRRPAMIMSPTAPENASRMSSWRMIKKR